MNIEYAAKSNVLVTKQKIILEKSFRKSGEYYFLQEKKKNMWSQNIFIGHSIIITLLQTTIYIIETNLDYRKLNLYLADLILYNKEKCYFFNVVYYRFYLL